jgi:hypothetical protein
MAFWFELVATVILAIGGVVTIRLCLYAQAGTEHRRGLVTQRSRELFNDLMSVCLSP